MLKSDKLLCMEIIYTILHIFAAIIGAGGAYMSDVMFMSSIKDSRITKTELRFLKEGSTLVIIGLVLAYISGLLIFSTNPELYMVSDKFWSKVTVVLVITINGYFFHRWHLPVMKKHEDKDMKDMKHLRKDRGLLVISGAISAISWTFAIVLGTWRGIPFTYSQIVFTYLVILILAVIFAMMLFRKRMHL